MGTSATTIPLTVIAMLTTPSTTRRGRRAATRNPRSRGTGSRAEIAISQAGASGWAGRVGQRVDGAGAGGADGGNEGRDDRDPECHGRHHTDRGHGERRRTRAAEEAGTGSVSKGAASHPAASPAAAATRATTTYSASSTAATRLGVPPTALSSPTRRVWSAIRPPTSTATLATASRPSSQAPISRGSALVSAPARWCSSRMSCQDCRIVGAARRRSAGVRVDERRALRPGRPASGSST